MDQNITLFWLYNLAQTGVVSGNIWCVLWSNSVIWSLAKVNLCMPGSHKNVPTWWTWQKWTYVCLDHIKMSLPCEPDKFSSDCSQQWLWGWFSCQQQIQKLDGTEWLLHAEMHAVKAISTGDKTADGRFQLRCAVCCCVLKLFTSVEISSFFYGMHH